MRIVQISRRIGCVIPHCNYQCGITQPILQLFDISLASPKNLYAHYSLSTQQMFDVKVIGISPHHLRKTKVNTMPPFANKPFCIYLGPLTLMGTAEPIKWALGCVNSHPAAEGSKEAGFTQPRAHLIHHLCT